MGKLKTAIWFFIHRNRRNKFVGRFARLCKNIHRASEHPGYELETSGEKDVLLRAVAGSAPIIFDVGANIGDWTAMARKAFPKAEIHAFELSPTTADILAKRFEDDPKVIVHCYGLSSSSGEVEFFSYPETESILNGMRSPLHSHVPHTVERAIVRTGDEVCEELGITSIDFLKVDAEGADLEVLKGFAGSLESQRIKAIQFEHEGGGHLLDFYRFLLPFKYKIGKLYANYVDFREHHVEMEHFLGPNYVAIQEGEGTLTKDLKIGW